MSISERLSSLPTTAGVYIYKNSNGEIIYVGKAVNLARRIKQYFQRDDALGEKTSFLVAEIADIEIIETLSEFDALLLEAKLIKTYKPKYNTIAKDDKSPLYIAISIYEPLPRVYLARESNKTLKDDNESSDILYFGPFQSSKIARSIARSLRRVVPYCTQKQRNGKKCFYTHLGLCNPCPSYIAKLNNHEEQKRLMKLYRKNIFRLRDILSGKSTYVIQDMEKEMDELSRAERFEEAALVRNQLQALKSILIKRYDPLIYVQGDTMIEKIFEKEQEDLLRVLRPYYPTLTSLQRIECFDVSNTLGTNASASMVVMINGKIDNREYRRFKIKTEHAPNDTAMMKEALERRFRHPEWEFPDLLIVDGGKGQVSAAKEVVPSDIPIIGLAKREEEIIVPHQGTWNVIRLPFSNEGLKMLQRLRDEAHRFAISYHKLLRSKQFL
ncbi:MAG: GIY-YIG nuclease family protein [Patescibacteria group bacterium]|nr:GIY-YIG nuclease family protein [Patescibacteria group bacterium]